MEFSAIQRDRLYRKLEPLVGADEADYLMSVLPPGGWAEVATRTDVRELRAEMSDLRSELRADMAELRSELKADMAELRSELEGDFAELRGDFAELKGDFAELKGDFAELRGDFAEVKGEMGDLRSQMVTRDHLDQQLRLHIDGRVGAMSRTWLFGTMAMQAATVGGIIAALRL